MNTFKELGLRSEIERSLEELGYIEPTPIQAKAIPFILANNTDLIGLAQTGTGKTAAFGLPVLNKIKAEKGVQALILCPTRELCLQIVKELSSFAKYLDHVTIAAVYGGAGIEAQMRHLKNGANVIVGTPGRVHDMIRRRVLSLSTLDYLILDEADEMLDMGFKDDLDKILSGSPEGKQTLLFSATMSPVVRNIASEYMNEPEEIAVSKKNIGADKVEHKFYVVKPNQKYEALRRVLDSVPNIYGILFCRTRNEAAELADRLKDDRYLTEALHGDVSQNLRTQIMEKFRQRKVQLLVATDVAARGIDVNDLTHVINYNLPDVNEIYVHRSGRTGRAQKSGVSLSIVTPRDMRKISDLERKIGKPFIKSQVPTGQEICEKQLIGLVEKMKTIELDQSAIAPFMPFIEAQLGEMEREEILARFIAAEFNHFLNLYQDSQDLSSSYADERPRGRSGERGERGERSERRPRRANDEENFTNVSLNIGRNQGLDKKALFALLNAQKELKGADIGRIELTNNSTTFGIEKSYAPKVARCLKNVKFRGFGISAESEEAYGGGSKRAKSFGREKKSGKDFSDRKDRWEKKEGKERKERSYGKSEKRGPEKRSKDKKGSR